MVLAEKQDLHPSQNHMAETIAWRFRVVFLLGYFGFSRIDWDVCVPRGSLRNMARADEKGLSVSPHMLQHFGVMQ